MCARSRAISASREPSSRAVSSSTFGDGADLVAAVVARGPAEVALAVPLRRLGDERGCGG